MLNAALLLQQTRAAVVIQLIFLFETAMAFMSTVLSHRLNNVKNKLRNFESQEK